MNRVRADKPVVLCFSGLDPSGGAGLQADIETLHALGCHCTPIATALTVQDTRNATRMVAVAPELIAEQARKVLADMPVSCFKLGLLGSVGVIGSLRELLAGHSDIPAVMDPVHAAGGGHAFGNAETLAACRKALLPLMTVATPNLQELLQLAPAAESPEAAAMALLREGCGNVLLTGGDELDAAVHNRWYRHNGKPVTFCWPRLEHEYHGSGCTLASAVAGNIALGLELGTALERAQEFTWHALEGAFRAGGGQHLPDRRRLGRTRGAT